MNELIVQEEPWAEFAYCKNAPTRIFFPELGETAAQARSYCSECAVVDACLFYGMKTRSTGVFGGQLIENGKIKKSRRARQAIQDARPQKVVDEAEARRMHPTNAATKP